MKPHVIKYNATEYEDLLREFQDLINSDPHFNYRYSEFNLWIKEVVQNDFTYNCQAKYHLGEFKDLPDYLFPTVKQAKAGMNPEICVECQV